MDTKNIDNESNKAEKNYEYKDSQICFIYA